MIEKEKYLAASPVKVDQKELISLSEANNTLDLKKYYVVLSPLLTKSNNDLSKVLYKKYLNFKNSAKVSGDFQYNSGSNKKFLSVAQLKKLLQKSVI